jgi:flagellin
MRINHNIAALNTHRQLSSASTAQGKNMEKLSSGLRINRAGDDAAGLAISEKMRGQIRGLDQAARNSQDGISMIQTAEGALNETHDMLQRMRELVVQANNDTNTAADRQSIQKEVDALATEITDTAIRTEFNTQKLITGNLGVKAAGTGSAEAGLKTAGVSIDASGAKTGGTFTLSRTLNDITLTDGNVTQKISVTDATAFSGTLNFDKLGIKLTSSANVDFSQAGNVGTIATTGNSATLQIGANGSQTLTLQFNDMQATALGTSTGNRVSNVDVTSTTQNFNTRLQIVDDAIKQVSDERSKMGAVQNRLEHTINNLNTSSENLTAAESRVRDVDYALAA